MANRIEGLMKQRVKLMGSLIQEMSFVPNTRRRFPITPLLKRMLADQAEIIIEEWTCIGVGPSGTTLPPAMEWYVSRMSKVDTQIFALAETSGMSLLSQWGVYRGTPPSTV